MSSKCSSIKNQILPISILLICLFQLYFQYSSIITPQSEIFDKKTDRNSTYIFRIGNRQFNLNLYEIKDYFDDNPLMKIKFFKNITLNFFKKINETREVKLDTKNYMIFYLMIHDIIYLIIVYLFIYGGYKSGIIKIVYQALKFYFAAKRLKPYYENLCFCHLIKNHFETTSLKNLDKFNPEGFQIFCFLCNYGIFLDIILLIILIKNKCGKKKEEFSDINLTQEKEIINKEKDNNNINNISCKNNNSSIINEKGDLNNKDLCNNNIIKEEITIENDGDGNEEDSDKLIDE